MKILVTGYRGFIAKNLIPALSNHTLVFYEWGEPFPNIRDLDWVVHLGALSSTTETDVDKVMKQNYDFSKWLLNQCIVYQVNFQYASSASVYGQLRECIEDGPVNPQSPYAWSKYMFDRHVNETLKNRTGIHIQGFRYFNVYGPHEDHKKDQASPYHKFTKSARDLGYINLFEHSEQYFRDFVPVELVVDVHKKFFTVEESGIWNVGTGVAKSFQQVGEEIANKYNAEIKYIPMPDAVKNQYQEYTCADLTKLKKHYTI